MDIIKRVGIAFLAAVAVSAHGAEPDGWVADPYRATGAKWKKHVIKGRDFWHLLDERWFDKPGVSEHPFVQDSGTYRVKADMEPALGGFTRRICVRGVTARNAKGAIVPATFELTSDEPGTTIDRGDGFTVLSAPFVDLAVRYLPAHGRISVRAKRPFSRLEISHGTAAGSDIADVEATSTPAKILSLTQRRCVLELAAPADSLDVDIASAAPSHVLRGMVNEAKLRDRLLRAPFLVFAPPMNWTSIGAPEGFVDRREFEKAVARYPETYLGMEVTEWDANFLQKITHGAAGWQLRDLMRTKKIPTDRNGMVANMASVWDDFTALWGGDLVGMSGGLNFELFTGDFGARVVSIEMSGERWTKSQRLELMYTLSAARQFDIPSFLYIAYFSGAQHPDSRRSRAAHSEHTGCGTDWGMAPSLGTRNYYTFYYMGGNYVSFESQPHGQIESVDADGKSWRLTANGRAIEDIYEWSRSPKAARGDGYAPILFLEDRRAGDDQAHPLASRKASFYGLFDSTDGDLQLEYMMRAISSPDAHASPTDPAGGTCHFNSSLGNVFNMALANPLRSGDIAAEHLAKYAAVVVAGDLVWSETIANRVKRYVADGGTLVITAGQSHPFDAAFLGAEFREADVAAADGLQVCRARLMPGTKVLKAASNGMPLVTASRYGAGQVDLVLSPFFRKALAAGAKPDERFVAPPQVKEVLESLQAAVLPFKVSGECEFTVDRVDDGSWRVCLVNNLGSVKDPKSSVEQFLPEWVRDVTLTLPAGATAEELRFGARPAVSGRDWTFKVPPAGVLVVKVDGVSAVAKGVQAAAGAKAYSPVRNFFRRFETTGRPNDGFRYDPAERMPKGTAPALVGEWLAKNGFKDSSGNGHDMKVRGNFAEAEGAAVSKKGSSPYCIASFKADYTLYQGTIETWVKPSADAGAFKADSGGRGRQGGVLFLNNGSIYVGYTGGRWFCTTMGGLRRLDMIGPEARPEWTHLAVTFDRELVRLYVNGREAVGENGPIRRQSEEGRDGFSDKIELIYGAANPAWGLFFRGGMKGVKYYSRCFSPEEVREKAGEQW